MVRTERYENAFIVALIVRKVTAIFVDSLHADTNNTNTLHGRGRPRLHRGWLLTGEDNDHAKNRCRRERPRPNPSSLDVGASVSLVPSSAYS